MSLIYNLDALREKNITPYTLLKCRVISGSTCTALYRQSPINTDTLLRIISFAGLKLEDFLICPGAEAPGERSRGRIDLGGLTKSCVISKSARKNFVNSRPMSLSTIYAIAESEGVSVLSFLKTTCSYSIDGSGRLKKAEKMVYLTEW